MSLITWNSGTDTFVLHQTGAWHELAATGDYLELRKRFITIAADALPFKSFITFPPTPLTVARFYCTWPLSATEELVRAVVEERFPSLAPPFQPKLMQLPYSVDKDAPLLSTLSPLEQALYGLITMTLKVEEIALYHFLGKNLSQNDRIVIQRELEKGKILSEVKRSQHPLLQRCTFGVTSASDRSRNDHFYVHCFLGFPLVTNRARFGRLTTVLSKKAALIMECPQERKAIYLPCDLELDLPPLDFTFLGKKYSVTIDTKKNSITYSSEAKGALFCHSFGCESFFGEPRQALQGYFACLARFISHLEDKDKQTLFSNSGALRELFNDLFAFRVQISFAEELQYKSYNSPTFPKTRLEALANEAVVLLPNLKEYRKYFSEQYEAVLPLLSFSLRTIQSLKVLVNFFRSSFSDGSNSFHNAFAYYGATSSQLLLHFAPEFAEIWTNETFLAILHIQKAYENHISATSIDHYEKYLLIARLDGVDITLFSLIKRALEDLDPIQLRLPPNRGFDESPQQTEAIFLAQLSNLYVRGSPLFSAIAGGRNPSMVFFNQKNYYKTVIQEAIARFREPLTASKDLFINVHGYTKDCFIGEFERGIEYYFDTFEVCLKNVVQAHIVDFVERFISGSTLLEPRFKHDILDLKHFTAGMLSKKEYFFIDGMVTFSEIVFRAIYELERRQKMTINGQLLLDTVHLFLQTISPLTKPNSLPYSCPSKEQKMLIEAKAQPEVAYYVHALVQPHWQELWISELIDLFSGLNEHERGEFYVLTLQYFSERADWPLIFILKSLKAIEHKNRQRVLEAVAKVHTASYQVDAICKLISLLDGFMEYEYPFIIMSLNILHAHQKDTSIHSADISLFMRTIKQKLANEFPDQSTAPLYYLIPNI